MVERHRLILEGFDCEVVPTTYSVRSFLKELTLGIGMTLWKGPYSWKMKVAGKEPGISGAVFWCESSSELHHYQNHRLVTLDIYSCKTFEPNTARNLFETYFRPKTVTHLIPRL